MKDKVTMLMILDGFGDNKNTDGNAIKLAKTPNIDKLMKKYPNTDIFTSGLHVGLPEGQMGNSEVGHTNIGAGRISRINKNNKINRRWRLFQQSGIYSSNRKLQKT